MGNPLPRDLYDAAGCRALDHAAIEQCGIAGFDLMQRAGLAALTELRGRWPLARRLAIISGSGNNGGDGFVVAAAAHKAGLAPRLYVVGERSRIHGDAAQALDLARRAGVRVLEPPLALDDCDVIVDALFGTGLDREVVGPGAALIGAMNDARAPVVAVDLPSGLNASTGLAMGPTVRAALTVTFIGVKQGLLTGDGPEYTGEVVFAPLDLPEHCYSLVTPTARRDDYAGVCGLLAPRARTAHKGHFGHVLVIGGGPGYAGAARMAAEAAARVGAGLVSLATHPQHAAAVTRDRPEIMCHAVADAAALRALARRATVIALGPGLGQDEWGRRLFCAARELALPQVVDADALNLLAQDPQRADDSILTPHPGEAARLLGCATSAVVRDRFATARQLAERYGGVIVLKGCGSIVQSGDGAPAVIDVGNPGMASGGMGDVLTGVVAGLLAQGLGLEPAARVGAVVHAAAAERAVAEGGGERGLLAGDLMPYLRALVNPACG